MEKNAEIIIRQCILDGLSPDIECTHSAGADYGYAAAWRIDGRYNCVYRNNAETNFWADDDLPNLRAALVGDDDTYECAADLITARLSAGYDLTLHTDGAGSWIIVTETEYYGSRTVWDYLRTDHGDPLIFRSISGADAYIRSLPDYGPLLHNEVSVPEYHIVDYMDL
jgi:hypothetical protein